MPEPTPGRLPPWLKKSIPAAPSPALASCLADLRLDTVCRGARCPNRLDCHHRGRAAFLIMGPNCSRACRFCAIPADPPLPLDPGEPERLGQAAARLALRHVVVTSVTRDDLPDGGAGHFAATIRELRRQAPAARLEILVPDFAGNLEAWAVVVDAAPDVFNHNLETVPRLYPLVRPGADYRRSLDLLTFARERAPGLATKSGIMLGLGEETAEVLQAGKDLLAAGVDMLTVGQYLRPAAPNTLAVERFVPPEEFDALGQRLREMGFRSVASAPFVRSSYNAMESFLGLAEGEG